MIHGSAVTDTGLASLAAHRGGLRDLRVYNCKGITDAGLATLLRRQARLRDLCVEDCENVTPRFPIHLVDMCPRLEDLDVSRIYIETMDIFQEQRPGVDIRGSDEPEHDPAAGTQKTGFSLILSRYSSWLYDGRTLKGFLTATAHNLDFP